MVNSNKPRTRNPPYPRPVARVCADDVVLDEIESHTRAAKKRRIEENATAYLRGEQLYIMSAQLRGPFGEGWRNPWATGTRMKKKRKSVGDKGLMIEEQIPEMVPPRQKQPPKQKQKQQQKQRVILSSSSQEQRNAILEARDRWIARKSASQGDVELPFSKEAVEDVDRRTPKQKPEKRIEEWLRTSEPYPTKVDVDVDVDVEPITASSPTPIARRKSVVGTLINHAVKSPRFNKTPVGAKMVDKSQSQNQDQEQSVTDAVRRVQQLSRNFTKVLDEVSFAQRLHGVVTDPQQQSSEQSNGANDNDDDDADNDIDLPPIDEACLASTKGITQQVKPHNLNATDDLDRIESSFGEEEETQHDQIMMAENPTETAKQSDHQLHKDLERSANRVSHDAQMMIDGAAQVPTAQPIIFEKSQTVERRLTRRHSKPAMPTAETTDTKIAISTEVSCASTTEMLPSAQRVPQLQQTPSSGFLEIQMLPPNLPLRDSDTQADPVSKTPQLRPQITQQSILQDADSLKSLTSIAVKANTNGTTIARAKSEKKRKRASFAPDIHTSMSSHGSLKISLNAKVSKNVGSLHSASVSKENTEQDFLDHEDRPPRKKVSNSSMQSIGGAMKAPKSILRSTNPSPSPNSTRKNTISMIGQSHERQLGRTLLDEGQNELLGHEDFDLDAAIDDLGSFLGTWDTEKEASGIIH